MATKAQLETELAELKRQLADRPAANADKQDKKPAESGAPEDARDIDWDKEIGELMTQIDEFPQKKPLLLALGAFAVGFLIGRSR